MTINGTYMYVVSGSRQRMIMETEVKGSGMSPSITHGDLAPDKMSSTKLSMVSKRTSNSREGKSAVTDS